MIWIRHVARIVLMRNKKCYLETLQDRDRTEYLNFDERITEMNRIGMLFV
jgi:hypothetical protein